MDQPTVEKLLQAGQRLMLTRGYSAATVDEICAEAGVTKGGFFHHFRSKEDFARTVLDHYWTCTQEMLRRAPSSKCEDPLDRLHGYLDLFVGLARDPSVEKSCLFGNLAQEVSPESTELRTACARGFRAWAEQIARDLGEAKRRYAPSAAFEPVSLAEYFIAIYEGSLVLVKATGDARVLERNVEHFRRYLDSLFVTTAKSASHQKST